MAIETKRLNQISDLVEKALDGDARSQGEIKAQIREAQESHSTSDFPEALRAVTAQAFMAEYEQIPSVYTQYTRQYSVASLRPQAFYSLATSGAGTPSQNAGEQIVTERPGGIARVPELTEYPEISFQAAETSFGIAKYGARVSFSFEMLLNDDWGVLETLPTQLAQLARNQEDIVAVEAIASSAGPNPAFFNAEHRNRYTVADGFATDNAPLSVESLEAAMTHVRTNTFNGNPVIVSQFTVMVPPALEAEAKRILGVTAFEINDPVNGTYTYANPVSGVQLIVNPWLPIIDKSANANTTWYLLPSGSQGPRPAVVFAKLRGREAPELRISNATGNYLGGGEVPGREGDFLSDDIQFRVRHFMGSAGIAFETAVASNGSGAA